MWQGHEQQTHFTANAMHEKSTQYVARHWAQAQSRAHPGDFIDAQWHTKGRVQGLQLPQRGRDPANANAMWYAYNIYWKGFKNESYAQYYYKSFSISH